MRSLATKCKVLRDVLTPSLQMCHVLPLASFTGTASIWEFGQKEETLTCTPGGPNERLSQFKKELWTQYNPLLDQEEAY